MRRQRETIALTPEQLERAVMREASIGAFARRRRRRRIALGLAGLALIGAAFALYWQLRPQSVGTAAGYPARLGCTLCGYRESRAVAYSQEFPMPCPRCQETALRLRWQCNDCMAQFFPGAETPVRCGNCGSDQVGAAIPP